MIADEEAQQVGLPLYPDGKLSDFALSLQDAGNRQDYMALIQRYDEVNKQKPITELKAVNPVIAAFNQWLDFKARPIKLEDFKNFVATLQSRELLRPDDVWRNLADNLILAIERDLLHTRYCLDFQLLIRICYLIRLCLEIAEKGYKLRKGVTADLINQILDIPILLPAGILKRRCFEDCKAPDQMSLPAVDPKAVMGSDRNPCQCKCDDSCQPPSNFCICIKPYIGDLFVIKEQLARFEAGDIADIENILAGEQKLRKHRTLFRTESTTETENEVITSEERDHEVNEKFSLQSEVKSTVDEKVNVDAGVTATLKYGDSVTITPHANVTASFGKTESQSVARSYAKDLLDRSISKVQVKVRKLQISKVLSEVEEKNAHSIDNTQPGANHRAGIYYWVNKVTHAQVYNYGKHMMFDVIVPEPAAIFKKLYSLKLTSDKNAKAPPKPDVTPQGILRNTYGGLLNQYAISTGDDIHPPDPSLCVEVAFSKDLPQPDNTTGSFSSNEFKTPDIPAGYKASRMDYAIRASTGHPKSTGQDDQVAVSVNAGDYCLMFDEMNEWRDGYQPNQDWKAEGSHNMRGEEGSVTVAIAGFSSLALSLSGSISVTCVLTAEAFEKWQTQIYNLIMADYNRKLDAYNSSANKDDQLFQIKGRNPFLNREIERNEFKRNIIAILMCNYFNGMGSMMEQVAPCGYPEINFEKLDRDAPIIQFFEQVFEWEYVTYLFYHSMWARKCKWADLIDEDSGDPLFDKFLMSGAARVQVPIRPGLEAVFSWFLKTSQIWGATGKPPVAGDADYVAMIQELKEANQGDYSDRPGLVEAVKASDTLALTDSTFYWDFVANKPATLTLDNDIDREILVNFKVYRIVKVEQAVVGDNSKWNVTIDQPYPDPSAKNMKHAVGALYVGSPWEIVVPTELVYLRNKQDLLPVYPLS